MYTHAWYCVRCVGRIDAWDDCKDWTSATQVWSQTIWRHRPKLYIHSVINQLLFSFPSVYNTSWPYKPCSIWSLLCSVIVFETDSKILVSRHPKDKQLTQSGTHNSVACLKAQCKQNLSLPILAAMFFTLVRGRQAIGLAQPYWLKIAVAAVVRKKSKSCFWSVYWEKRLVFIMKLYK